VDKTKIGIILKIKRNKLKHSQEILLHLAINYLLIMINLLMLNKITKLSYQLEIHWNKHLKMNQNKAFQLQLDILMVKNKEEYFLKILLFIHCMIMYGEIEILRNIFISLIVKQNKN
jgi:hypothetical protein